jgi:GNAT superfamily N-acetyltransferase
MTRTYDFSSDPARVITDGVTFGWLRDVVVDPDLRGAGAGSALMPGMGSWTLRRGPGFGPRPPE